MARPVVEPGRRPDVREDSVGLSMGKSSHSGRRRDLGKGYAACLGTVVSGTTRRKQLSKDDPTHFGRFAPDPALRPRFCV